MGASGLNCQSAMVAGDVFIAEQRDPGDGMQVLRMEEADKFGQITDGIVFFCLGARGCSKGTLMLPSLSLMSNTTAFPPAACQRLINSIPRVLPAVAPVR